MTLDALIMLLGSFVAVLPYLGVPNNWDSVLFLITGIIIIILGIMVRRRGGNKDQSSSAVPSAVVEKAPLDLTRHDAEL